MRCRAASKWSNSVVQIERRMPLAQYLTKSRHGIWYYRWVVPPRVRAQHRHLPKELKRSTKTADMRVARVRARRLHMSLAVPFMTVNDPDNFPDLGEIRKFELAFDPVTGALTHVKAEEHEWPAVKAAIADLNPVNIAAMMMRHIEGRSAPDANKAATTNGTNSNVPTVAEAFRRYSKEQVSLSTGLRTRSPTPMPRAFECSESCLTSL